MNLPSSGSLFGEVSSVTGGLLKKQIMSCNLISTMLLCFYTFMLMLA